MLMTLASTQPKSDGVPETRPIATPLIKSQFALCDRAEIPLLSSGKVDTQQLKKLFDG